MSWYVERPRDAEYRPGGRSALLDFEQMIEYGPVRPDRPPTSAPVPRESERRAVESPPFEPGLEGGQAVVPACSHGSPDRIHLRIQSCC
jgi:hypothetical protein